ncbi:IgLON family member 5 [Stylophora pistillata]|uniref:IgLON family member 5 n=1 Tax=Stylophora pistillata TaxID=50429 RepID=A0A2B4REQ4_STYPI|nr:IgLON family member 5 [Stylophora pistillata]
MRSPSDGGSVRWYEPIPVKTLSDSAEVLPPVIVSANEGEPTTLNWNYSLTLGLAFGNLKFNNDGIVTAADDKANGEFSCSLIDGYSHTWKRAIQVQVLVMRSSTEMVESNDQLLHEWNKSIEWIEFGPVSAKITGIKGVQTVHEGSNLQLTCEASGRPEPNISWVKQMAGNQGNTGVQQEGKVLTITKISRTDSGTFNCTAYNGFGEPDSQAVHVNVTYPATIANKFQTEYLVGVQQSVTLTCEAEGNPKPVHSWIPCNTEQVCDKNTLAISQVLNDASYTCRAVNVHGPDMKTAIVYIAGNVINITIVITSENCTDEKYNTESLLLRKLEEELKRAFAGKLDYERVQSMSVRCGSIIVDLALKFNSTTKEQDVIITLNDAVKNGKLGDFGVGALKGKRPDVEPSSGGASDVESSGGVATSPPEGPSGEMAMSRR